MYQFITGFAVGVYMGTRYDMREYVDRVETTIIHLITRLEKRKFPSSPMQESSETDVKDIITPPVTVDKEDNNNWWWSK